MSGRRDRPTAGEKHALVGAAARAPNGDLVMVARESTHSGPLPSADELQRYHAVDPSVTAWILKRAEENMAHDRAMDVRRADIVEGSDRRAHGRSILIAWLVHGTTLAAVAAGVAVVSIQPAENPLHNLVGAAVSWAVAAMVEWSNRNRPTVLPLDRRQATESDAE